MHVPFGWGYFMPPQQPQPEPDPETEAEPDEGWLRTFDTFLELGFSPEEAFALAVERVSPSALRELIRHGADRHQAASILL